MKKKLAIILALAMVISLLPAMALTTNAATGTFAQVQNLSDLQAGDQIVILAKRTAGNFFYPTSDLGTATTKRYTAIDSGLSSAVSISDPEDAAVWTLEVSGENWKIKSNLGTYIDWTSGNSGLLTESGTDIIIRDNDTEVNGTFQISLVSDTTRILGLNNTTGNNYFGFYTGTQADDLYILKLFGGAPTPTPAADTANANVIANVTVAEITHTVTYGTAANGTFTVTDGTNTIASGSAVVEGTTIYVNASPAAGFQVDSIMVNGTPIAGTSFTLTANAAITVTFSLIPASNFTVAWNDGTGYTVAVMDGETPVINGGSVEDGTEIAITISLNPNYELVSITDGTDALVDEAGVYNYSVTANVTFVITVTEIIEQPYAYVIPASIDFGTLDLTKTTATASYDVKLTTLGTNAHVYVAINKTSGNLVSGTYQIPYTITGNFTFAAAETKQGSASLNIADVLALNLPAGSYNFSDAVIFTVTAD